MEEQKQKDPVTVIRPPDAPPAPPCQTICMADLTPEEREKFIQGCCPKFRRHVKEYGGYDMAKRDGCKEMREAEEAKKRKEVETLQQRNLILEQQARLQEQAFLDYKAQTEERFNKLAELIKSLK